MPLTSLGDLATALAVGARRRATAATNMNAASSRSHAVFTLRLEVVVEAAAAEGGESAASVTRTSLFRLVDLAGVCQTWLWN